MRYEAIIICGNAGVGKTTYGRRLAQQRGALFLDIDVVSEGLVQAGLRAMGHDPSDRDSPIYKQIFREPIHDTLFSIACDNLINRPCIIVAPFTQERRDPTFLDTCRARLAANVRILYLYCDDVTRHQRLIGRNNPRDASKLDDWRQYAAHGRDNGLPPFAHEAINTAVERNATQD